MKYCIKGTIETLDSSDFEIISKYYFQKFLKYKDEKEYSYNTGHIVHTGFHFMLEERMLLKGIIALITGTYPEFRFKSLNHIDENNQVLFCSRETQYLCIAPRSGLDCMNHEELDATQVYFKAFEDLDLMRVIVLFARRLEDKFFIGWSELYSIYEIIGKSVRTKGKKLEEELVDKLSINSKKLKNFKFLANKSRNPFYGMRHGEELSQEDRKKIKHLVHPGAIEWAFDFIRDLAMKWLDYLYKIKIVKPTRNNDAYGYNLSGEPLELISLVEEYEAKHYPSNPSKPNP
ncbi:MAG: hypothetical protein K2W94_04265 [Alphaproteobacteria bacterium]|nr:hypothetical protein [Alphaproteobacteria bacterium]